MENGPSGSLDDLIKKTKGIREDIIKILMA